MKVWRVISNKKLMWIFIMSRPSFLYYNMYLYTWIPNILWPLKYNRFVINSGFTKVMFRYLHWQRGINSTMCLLLKSYLVVVLHWTISYCFISKVFLLCSSHLHAQEGHNIRGTFWFNAPVWVELICLTQKMSSISFINVQFLSVYTACEAIME